MDYTKLPRPLVYRDRTDIKEFTDQNQLNKTLVDALFEYFFSTSDNAEMDMLNCLNNAYYLCTIILLDESPLWRFANYRSLADYENTPFGTTACDATLTVVCILLGRLDNDWSNKNGKLINKLHASIKDKFSFDNVFRAVKIVDVKLKHEIFAPRDINNNTIKTIEYELEDSWSDITCEYKEKNIWDLLYALKTNVEGKLAIVGCIENEVRRIRDTKKDWLLDMLQRISFEIDEPIFDEDFYAMAQAQVDEMAYWDDTRPLQQRIDELEKENQQLKEQLQASTENKIDASLIAEKDEEICELKDRIETLESDLDGYKTKEKGMSAHQAAILVTALCKELNQMPANGRENLSPLLLKMWGFTDSTSRQALRKKVTQEKANKLADYIDELNLTPKIARLIRELPQKLSEENKERLYALNQRG